MFTGVAGGWKAISSVLAYTRQIGVANLIKAVTSKNACKACAFGTGGQNGGIYNEQKKGIEICNKNIQAHTSDIRQGIPASVFFENSLATLQTFSGKQLEDLGRLTLPLYKKATDNHFSPISYEQALTILVNKMKATQPERSFFYASGRSSNEAAFSLQLLARLWGTNNVNNCSYYCHQASGAALSETVGTSTATVEYNDLDKTDLIFLFGANPASNHPRFLKALIRLRRRGGKVIVVNPAKEPGLVKFASPSDIFSMLKGGESIASTYIQPNLGGDIPFIQGLIKYLWENEGIEHEYINQYCEGFPEFAERISALDWHDIVSESGVTRLEIETVAKLYQQSKHAIFCWSMGLTHHLHGVGNIQSLVALALSRGMVGKPGAGLLPLRGHSNIQGTGSMGFTPKLKEEIEKNLRHNLKITLPTTKGLDTMSCMEAAYKGNMDLAFMLGGNLFAANPDSTFTRQAFDNIGFKCFISSTLNQSHVNGFKGESLVLPIKVRDEEDQSTTQESMFNFVRLSDGGINRFPQLKTETDIICSLGEKLIDPTVFNFNDLKNHATTRTLISQAIAGFNKIRHIDQDKEEFHIDGRILHTPQFHTSSKKAKFIFHNIPKRDRSQLYLTTVRSEGQFNSIIFHEKDSYRGQSKRNIVMMSKQDIANFGLKQGDQIDLVSQTGELNNLEVREFNIRPGNVMTYYPEANVLVPKSVDHVSKTPAFKSIAVSIRKREKIQLV